MVRYFGRCGQVVQFGSLFGFLPATKTRTACWGVLINDLCSAHWNIKSPFLVSRIDRLSFSVLVGLINSPEWTSEYYVYGNNV